RPRPHRARPGDRGIGLDPLLAPGRPSPQALAPVRGRPRGLTRRSSVGTRGLPAKSLVCRTFFVVSAARLLQNRGGGDLWHHEERPCPFWGRTAPRAG